MKIRSSKYGWLLGILLVVILGVSGCDYEMTKAPTVTALKQNGNGEFDSVIKGVPLSFPYDHGKHANFRTEWWYFTTNVTASDGQTFGIQWTLFRMAQARQTTQKNWDTPQLYMAHTVITDGNQVWKAERFARGGIGQAGVTLSPFHAWLDNWSWKAMGKSIFPGVLTFSDQNVSVKLQIRNQGRVVPQGEHGFSAKDQNEDVASYYYSTPFLNVKGEVTLNGKTVEVTGKGWFDHEWSSAMLSKQQKGWDWFSIHLADGRALMVAQVRKKGKQAYYFGSLSESNGSVIPLTPRDIQMIPIRYTKIEGRNLPLKWSIHIPKYDLKLNIDAVNDNQWLNFKFPYWEGPIVISGSQKGTGFMELTGY